MHRDDPPEAHLAPVVPKWFFLPALGQKQFVKIYAAAAISALKPEKWDVYIFSYY